MHQELTGLVKELQRVLGETRASPTYVRLLETTLDPCWDWASGTPRLMTAHVLARALDNVERRLLQLSEAERHADTRFDSLRINLGAGHALTGGQRQVKPSEFRRDEDQRQMRLVDRQFLTHDGVSGRTIAERSRNASKHQLQRGTAAAADYRAAKNGIAPMTADDTDELEQRVEDKVQIAMAKGEFDDLEGKGRPLQRLQKSADNPFLDNSERLGFNLLQKHGFAPEWIQLQKEIRASHEKAKRELAAAWLGCSEDPCPAWLAHKDAFCAIIAGLNQKVRDYNLLCPQASQLPRFCPTSEVRAVRRGAREILGPGEHRTPKAGTVAAPAKRLMTPLREILRSSFTARTPPPADRPSVWTRVTDAFAFRRPSGASEGGQT